MKTRTTSLILAVAFGSVAFAQDSNKPSPFIQASAAYGVFGDFEDKMGVIVNAGVQFQKVHTLEIEAGYFNSGSRLWYIDSVKFMPVLASYRYSVQLGEKTTLFLGALAGITQEEVTILYSGVNGSRKEKDSPFTYGGKAGLKYELATNVFAELTATGLHASEGDFVTSGSYGYFSAGLSYRF